MPYPSSACFHIITPSYDRPALLLRAMESVRAQGYEDWRLWIVDDGSPEGTRAALDRIEGLGDRRIAVERLTANAGSNRARNTALEAALRDGRPGYVTFLDDDEVFLPDALRTMHGHAAALGFPEWLLFNAVSSSGSLQTRVARYGRGNYVRDQMLSRRLRGDPVHVIRKDVFGEARFSSEFRNAEEWFLWGTLALQTDYFAVNEAVKVLEYLPGGLSKTKPNRGRRLDVLRAKIRLLLPVCGPRAVSRLSYEYGVALVKAGSAREGLGVLRACWKFRPLDYRWYRAWALGVATLAARRGRNGKAG